MASTALILFVSAIALGLAWLLLLNNPQPKMFTMEDWEEKKWSIDVRVFERLVDRNEERYLAAALPNHQFVAYQRRRTHLALSILQLARQNCDMLIRLGALARVGQDAMLVSEAERLVAAATQLRLSLLLAKYCLWVKWLFPTWLVAVPHVENRYEHLLGSLLRVRQQSFET